MHKWVYISVLFTVYYITLCDESVQNETKTATITNDTLRKIRHGSRHLYDNGTSQSTNHTKSQNQVNLRMVTVCVTPNNDNGYCMPLANCTKLMNQVGNKSAQQFLQKSRCGPKNENSKNPMICCGKYDNYKQSITVKDDDIFPKNCGHQNVSIKGRILGGKEAVLGEFPWMARLIHKNKHNIKTFGCSGLLIAPKFVLTAAHCLKSDNVKTLGPIFEVQLGEHNTETKIDCNSKNTKCADPPQVIRVKKNLVHHHYNVSSVNHHHDIGLIHLKKAASFTNYVLPICLVHSFDFQPFEYWISGWGSTTTRSISPIKMKLSLLPFSHSDCAEKYKIVNIAIVENQICAGGKRNKDSCTGDSGGPLMVVKEKNHWFAAGIVSFGLGCGREGWPGIYTNITSHLPWIRKTILKRVTLH